MTEMRIEKSEIHLWQLEQADFELSSLQSEVPCLANGNRAQEISALPVRSAP